jgi:hypothetical protein
MGDIIAIFFSFLLYYARQTKHVRIEENNKLKLEKYASGVIIQY